MAIIFTTNPIEQRAADGISIAEQAVPVAPRIVGNNTVKVVGEFPWGPPDEAIKIDSADDLEAVLGHYSRPQDYGGFVSLTGKSFGPLYVVRVEADDAVAASRDIVDDTNDGAYTVTARYKTAAGNEITVMHEKVDADTFALTVAWGTYTEELGPFPFTADGMAAATMASKLVDLKLHTDAGDMPDDDDDPVALDGGDDGTLADLDWTGDEAAFKGLRALETTPDGGFVFAAEYTSPAWIESLRGYLADHRAEGCAQASPDDDFDSAATAAMGISDDRLSLALHRVRQRIRGEVKVVDLAPFVASVWSQINPQYSVADYDNRQLLKAVAGLPEGQSIGRPQWVRAQEVGGITLEMLDEGGFKFQAGITSDPMRPSMITRRMRDVVGATVGRALLPFQNKPGLDTYVIDGKRSIERALGVMVGQANIPTSRLISDYGVTVLGQTGSEVIYQVAVKLHGEMRFIIANVTVGEDIIVEEVLQS